MKKKHAIVNSIISFCLTSTTLTICLLSKVEMRSLSEVEVSLIAPAQAQITPDNTLGAESSRLTPNVLINNANADQIDGGAQRGSNLFHSFTQFNINNGQRVYFGNPDGVQNILTRVTGGQGSNILGTLGVNGNANLFLINPNGIVFGQNARLDIRGAFTATTANSLIFPNGVEFSATNPQAPPLLTINVPIGLQFGSQPGSITSQAINPLYVYPGSTLAFMGGEIALDGSYLFAENGQVKLGAVGGDTTVGLNVNGSSLGFQFPENLERAAINLTNRSVIATTGNNPIELFGGQISLNGSFIYGDNGGSIIVDANQLSLDNNSQIQSGTFGAAKGGDIQIQASDAVTLTNRSLIGSVSSGSATGAGGDITINAGKITVENSSLISALTTSQNSQGNGGNLTLNAIESVNINGGSILVDTGSVNNPKNLTVRGNAGNLTVRAKNEINVTNKGSLSVFSNGSGSTGNLRIETGTLRLQNNFPTGGVSAGASSSGSVGSISIQARNAVEVINSSINTGAGVKPKDTDVKPKDTNVKPENTSRVTAGDITIETQRINLKDGGYISTSTFSSANAANIFIKASEYVEISGVSPFGKTSGVSSGTSLGATGNGGNVTIETPRLSLTQGGNISATSVQSSGNPGNITIRAKDVELDGFVFIPKEKLNLLNDPRIEKFLSQPSLQEALSRFGGFDFTSNLSSEVFTSNADMRGGTIIIDTERLRLSNGGHISASVLDGRGQGGNLVVRANFLEINGKGSRIASFTDAGNGGDISLDIGELLLLRRGGLISTTAGRTQAGGDGGNININSPFIVAVPNENSDISANAYTGKGGNVTISTQAIFGIEPRPETTNQSDITASSDLGVQGQITITQPQVQPPQKLIELPTGLVDASTKFAQICPRGRNAKPLGSFVVTGRGSLPPNSFEPLAGITSLSPLATLDGENADTKLQKIVETDTGNSAPIVEAQGLVKTADGNIMLVAEAPTATPAATSSSAMCPGS